MSLLRFRVSAGRLISRFVRKQRDLYISGLLRLFFALVYLLSYQRQLQLGGLLGRLLISHSTKFRNRALSNIKLIFPALSLTEQLRIMYGCGENIGRFFMECYTNSRSRRTRAKITITGDGVEDIVQARKDNIPVILCSGHFGNYQVGFADFIRRNNYKAGVFYRPMNNRYFNTFYVDIMKSMFNKVFVKGKVGMKQMIECVRQGGMVGILNDQYISSGKMLSFMGKPARTNTMIAKIALKYKARLIPFYSIRQSNGIDFQLVVEPAIKMGNEMQMTQELNDSLTAQIHLHPEQWLWFHRRWK